MYNKLVVFNISIFLLLIIFNNSLKAQRIDFQELKKEIANAKNKKEKADAIMQFASALSPRQSELILQYSDSVISLSENNDSTYFMVASEYIKAVSLYRNNQFQEAKLLFKKCGEYFLNEENKEYSFKSNNFLGIIYLRTHSPDSAISVFKNILQTIPENEVRGRVSAYGNLGRAFRGLGNYSAAIDNFEKCIALDSTNQFSIANSYMIIAQMFLDMELYEKAINTLKKVHVEDLPHNPIKASYYNNLGETYFSSGLYDSAKIYLKKGILVSEQIRQYRLGIQNRIVLSEIFVSEGNYDSSILLLKKAELLLTEYKRPDLNILLNQSYASYYQNLGKYDSAIYHGKKVINIAELIRRPQLKKDIYQKIARAYESKGAIIESKDYFKKHANFKDSLTKSKPVDLFASAKAKYLVSEKEKELKTAHGKSSFFRSIGNNLLIVSLVLIFVIIFIYYKLKRSKNTIEQKEAENQRIFKEVEKHKKEVIELKSKAILPLDQIISIESDGHYLEFYLQTKDKPEVDRNRLKTIKELLPDYFVQIHKSFIINITQIKVKYSDKVILKNGRELTVSRTYKDELNKALGSKE